MELYPLARAACDCSSSVQSTSQRKRERRSCCDGKDIKSLCDHHYLQMLTNRHLPRKVSSERVQRGGEECGEECNEECCEAERPPKHPEGKLYPSTNWTKSFAHSNLV